MKTAKRKYGPNPQGADPPPPHLGASKAGRNYNKKNTPLIPLVYARAFAKPYRIN